MTNTEIFLPVVERLNESQEDGFAWEGTHYKSISLGYRDHAQPHIDSSCLHETNSSVCSHMCACMSLKSVNRRQSSLLKCHDLPRV